MLYLLTIVKQGEVSFASIKETVKAKSSTSELYGFFVVEEVKK